MADAQRKGGKKNRKHNRNKVKCQRYRDLVGKPNGKGKAGNKAGKNKI